MNLPLVLRISGRQILSRSNSGFVRTVSILSILGIAIGVAALLILNAFMEGFTGTIMEQLSAIHPPIEVRAPGEVLFPEDQAYIESLMVGTDGLQGTSPVLEKTIVAAGNSGDVAGVHMRGVDWTSELELLSGDRLTGVAFSEGSAVIGPDLASRLGVEEGDSVRFASTDVTAFSSMGRLLVDTIVSVRVAAVVDLGISEYNSGMVLTDIATARTMFTGARYASSLSLGIQPEASPLMLASDMNAVLREAYINGECRYMVCDAFITRHSNLFAALGLERTGMSIVLAMITVVALLNLLSALTMIALEHRRDSGVLRAMGANPATMLLIGLAQGGFIGAAGALSGVLFAAGSVFMINRFFPIKLESSIYWIDVLPGRLEPLPVLAVAGATLAACLAASLIPAISALSTSPSRAVRYE